jgi:hypothetical protein
MTVLVRANSMLSDPRLYVVRLYDNRKAGKDMEESGHGLLGVKR